MTRYYYISFFSWMRVQLCGDKPYVMDEMLALRSLCAQASGWKCSLLEDQLAKGYDTGERRVGDEL